MLLTGCGEIEKILTTDRDTHPDQSYECAEYPEEPTGYYTQKDVASYIIDARAAYNDCRTKLTALGKKGK